MTQENPFAKLFHRSASSLRLGVIRAGQPSEALKIDFISPQTLAIPIPLEKALKAFRKPDRPHTTWADLLIGRTVEERSSQAAEMKAVLEHAEKVVAWLGPGDAQNEIVVDTLRNLANRWQQARLHSHFPEYSNRATATEMMSAHAFLTSKPADDLQLTNTALWKAVQDIFDSSYFETTQSIPEMVLARKAVVAVGDQSLSWEDFNAALMAYLMLAPSHGLHFSPTFMDAYQRISRLELATLRKRNGDSLELAAMLKDARRTSCSDPREIIFAVLPIITPCERTKNMQGRPSPLTADYTKTLPEVIKGACKYIMEERQDVMLWSFGERPPCGRKITNLPSWAPDITAAPPLDVVYTTSNTSNGLRAWADPLTEKKLYVDSEDGLHVQAHVLDRITSVSKPFTQENCRRLVLEEWQRLPQGHQVERMWRALCLNNGAGMGETVTQSNPPSADTGASFQSLLAEERTLSLLDCTVEELMAANPELMARAAANPDINTLRWMCGKSQQFESLLRQNAIGRRFFQTESGRVGMTAIEDGPPSDSRHSSVDAPPLPNFDEALSEPMGQYMLAGFHAFLAQKNPEMARVLAQARDGTLLPGQRAPGVRSGDLVVAIVGGYQPYVLRPAKPVEDDDGDDAEGPSRIDSLDAESRYTYVGDCYLHGVMDGECFKERTWYGATRYRDVEKVDIVIV